MRFEEVQSVYSPDTGLVLSSGSVLFDPERLRLEGRYSDELAAYRARKHWIDVFESSFLLDSEHDFHVRVHGEPANGMFFARCEFLTACGRYAFWRLTHHQAPDVQSMVETAHLPSFSRRTAEGSGLIMTTGQPLALEVIETVTLWQRVRSWFKGLFQPPI